MITARPSSRAGPPSLLRERRPWTAWPCNVRATATTGTLGAFFAGYGLIDLAFGLFFLWVFLKVRSSRG